MSNTETKALSYPNDLKYLKTHEYLCIEGKDCATIGITAFAAHELGDITFVELPKAGTKLNAGDKFAVIESVKSVSDVYVPVSGEIIAVNEKLSAEPELVNADCYGEGWMIKIKMSNPDQLKNTMNATEYETLLA